MLFRSSQPTKREKDGKERGRMPTRGIVGVTLSNKFGLDAGAGREKTARFNRLLL